MLVHNIKGTSDRKPKDKSTSWIEFWERRKGYKPIHCGCENCKETKNLVGAHVQKTGNNTRDYWYIIPLCKKHNSVNFIGSFKISDESDLVRVTEDD